MFAEDFSDLTFNGFYSISGYPGYPPNSWGRGSRGRKKCRRIPKCEGDWQGPAPKCSLPRQTLQNKEFGAPDFWGTCPKLFAALRGIHPYLCTPALPRDPNSGCPHSLRTESLCSIDLTPKCALQLQSCVCERDCCNIILSQKHLAPDHSSSSIVKSRPQFCGVSWANVFLFVNSALLWALIEHRALLQSRGDSMLETTLKQDSIKRTKQGRCIPPVLGPHHP